MAISTLITNSHAKRNPQLQVLTPAAFSERDLRHVQLISRGRNSFGSTGMSARIRLTAIGTSEIQRRIIDDLLHDEEGADLGHARQRNELVAMQLVEVVNVADADLE